MWWTACTVRRVLKSEREVDAKVLDLNEFQLEGKAKYQNELATLNTIEVSCTCDVFALSRDVAS